MEKGSADACYQLAGYYADGEMGMTPDRAKANELFLKAGELGYAKGYCELGCSYQYEKGVERNDKKAKHYYELAAMMGDVDVRQNLGRIEWKAGNYQRTYKHLIIAARAGHTESLDVVKMGFQLEYVAKDEYASTLRAYHESQTEMKSKAREGARAYSQRYHERQTEMRSKAREAAKAYS